MINTKYVQKKGILIGTAVHSEHVVLIKCDIRTKLDE